MIHVYLNQKESGLSLLEWEALSILVSEWRETFSLTWREISSRAKGVFPSLKVSAGDQIDGIKLCNSFGIPYGE